MGWGGKLGDYYCCLTAVRKLAPLSVTAVSLDYFFAYSL